MSGDILGVPAEGRSVTSSDAASHPTMHSLPQQRIIQLKMLIVPSIKKRKKKHYKTPWHRVSMLQIFLGWVSEWMRNKWLTTVMQLMKTVWLRQDISELLLVNRRQRDKPSWINHKWAELILEIIMAVRYKESGQIKNKRLLGSRTQTRPSTPPLVS